MTNSRSRRVFALVMTLAVAAGACGGDDDATDSTPGASGVVESTAEAATDVLGAPNPADPALAPVKVGYMWAGVSAAADLADDEKAADATVKWINEYGGGIAGGHPLELVKCAAPEAAEAAACGSKMLEEDVSAVLFNVIAHVEPWATPVIGAGIPILGFTNADASLRVPGRVFLFSNTTAGLASFPAKVAAEIGAKQSTAIVIDVPALTGPIQALLPPAFETLGAGAVDIVPISPTAPDHGPDVQVALQKDPQEVHVVGNPAFCSLTIRALKDAGYAGTTTIVSACLDDPMKEQLGAALEGVEVSYLAGEDPSNTDYQQFVAIAAKYSPGLVPNGNPVGAYVVLEGFHRVMADFSGDFGPDAIAEHIATHDALPMPTIDGGSFKCDGTAVPDFAISCTSSFTYASLDAKGNPTSFTTG